MIIRILVLAMLSVAMLNGAMAEEQGIAVLKCNGPETSATATWKWSGEFITTYPISITCTNGGSATADPERLPQAVGFDLLITIENKVGDTKTCHLIGFPIQDSAFFFNAQALSGPCSIDNAPGSALFALYAP